jgi:hypothetical protein
MARKRKAPQPAAQPPQAEPTAPAETPQDTPAEHDAASAAADASRAPRSKWVSRFGSWADHEAGVYLTEDRQNRLMTIRFNEKPPEAVRKLMKEESGYRFDGEDQVWYKRISPASARQSREEAEELAFKAANLIRQENGLEAKKSFQLGM